MITMFFIFTIVMICVTMTALAQIARTLRESRHKRIAGLLFSLMSTIPITVLINIAISYILLSFTGSGMLAGMANLTSSVFVGIFGQKMMIQIYREKEDGRNSFWTRLTNLGKACNVSAFIHGWLRSGDQGRTEADRD